jgi:hypothetical protein
MSAALRAAYLALAEHFGRSARVIIQAIDYAPSPDAGQIAQWCRDAETTANLAAYYARQAERQRRD